MPSIVTATAEETADAERADRKWAEGLSMACSPAGSMRNTPTCMGARAHAGESQRNEMVRIRGWRGCEEGS